MTGVTVTVKESDAVPPLASATWTVMSAEPNWVGTGVTRTVRLAPEPPNTMLAVGTSEGLDEVAAMR